MDKSIRQQWEKFSAELKQTAEHLSSKHGDSKHEMFAALDQLLASEPPTTSEQLRSMMNRGKQIAADCVIDDRSGVESPRDTQAQAFADCENHEPIPMPRESIAEQAEKARSKP